MEEEPRAEQHVAGNAEGDRANSSTTRAVCRSHHVAGYTILLESP